MEKVKTRTAEFSIDQNRVLLITILPNVTIDFEDALDNALVIRHLTNGQKILKLTDSRVFWRITKKAKQVAFKENEKQTIARAVLGSLQLSSVLRNFFQELQKPNIPLRFFSDYDEAYEWLLAQKGQHEPIE